ncbi:unnamed protein product [Heligmosomoides polygyrus]|uniref:DUF1758 domain-containing protein n=1 Tax=Heligmosomoides polygyrus TaxID=6339 RepID=A0A183F4L4_HELPZ|nr:unnamed protein product [Heligmosomoides polygyrus]
MHTFGSLSPLQLPTTQHSIGIHANEGMRILNVKALQTLINNVKTVDVGNGVNFQSLVTTSRKPSLVIGADYIWELLLHDNFHIETLPGGCHLIHSSIGDIITGTPRLQRNYCYNSLTAENDALIKSSIASGTSKPKALWIIHIAQTTKTA